MRVLLLFALTLFAETTTLIIPCAGLHFPHLSHLLETYTHQTTLPDEVIVSLSSVRCLDSAAIAQLENQTAQTRIKVDTDRDTVYVQAEMQRDRQNAELRIRELDMKLQLAQLDYASKNALKLEDVKAKLADTSMKLNVQKDLTLAGMTSDLHKHHNPQVIQPAVEPVGRAPDGQAFVK